MDVGGFFFFFFAVTSNFEVIPGIYINNLLSIYMGHFQSEVLEAAALVSPGNLLAIQMPGLSEDLLNLSDSDFSSTLMFENQCYTILTQSINTLKSRLLAKVYERF